MNRLFSRLLSTTIAALTAGAGMMIASPEADAHGWRGRARVGVYIGAPVIAAPFWYHPRPYYYGYPYYSPPPTVYREEPTVYIEQNPVPAAPAPQAQASPQAQQQFWYYCQDTQTYYPHVQTCASPWQRVIPHAPPQQ